MKSKQSIYIAGKWRRQYHANPRQLTDEEVKQIESVPGWTWANPRAIKISREQALEELKALLPFHQGKCPTLKWLSENDYEEHAKLLRAYPAYFASLPRSKTVVPSFEERLLERKRSWGGKGSRRDRAFDEMLVRKRHSNELTAKQIARVDEVLRGFTWRHKRRSLEEKVERARELVKENGGHLPPLALMLAAGDDDVYRAYKKHPDAFVGIGKPPVKVFKAPSEWRAHALSLAEKNKGLLQKTCRLVEMKEFGLILVMRRHPELFEGIPREPIGFDETFRDTIKALAKAHNENSMTSAQKGAVANLRKRYKEQRLTEGQIQKVECLFTNWQWGFGRMSKEDQVSLAQRLAKANNGVLQAKSHLKRVGYDALVQCMNRYPKAFAHIPQVSQVKTNEEHVALVEKVAGERGGVRPVTRWFTLNGHSGTAHVLATKPELFAHIPVAPRKSKWDK